MLEVIRELIRRDSSRAVLVNLSKAATAGACGHQRVNALSSARAPRGFEAPLSLHDYGQKATAMTSYSAITHTRYHTRRVTGVPGSAKRRFFNRGHDAINDVIGQY